MKNIQVTARLKIYPGKTECVVREKYADSDAAMAHLGNVGEFPGQLFTISDFELEIYGTMSEELKNAVAAFNPRVYSFYQGI